MVRVIGNRAMNIKRREEINSILMKNFMIKIDMTIIMNKGKRIMTAEERTATERKDMKITKGEDMIIIIEIMIIKGEILRLVIRIKMMTIMMIMMMANMNRVTVMREENTGQDIKEMIEEIIKETRGIKGEIKGGIKEEDKVEKKREIDKKNTKGKRSLKNLNKITEEKRNKINNINTKEKMIINKSGKKRIQTTNIGKD